MDRSDAALFLFHGIFWAVFLPRILGAKARAATDPGPKAPEAEPRIARFSRAAVGFYVLGMSVLYWGIFAGLQAPRELPPLVPPQRVAGGALIVLGAAVGAWALLVFRSWRFRAEIDPGHELCTVGPFRFVRHPIYLSIDLFAVGSGLWVPSAIALVGVALVLLGGDVRARMEEKLLVEVFGDAYREYMGRTKRFVPGIY